MLNLEVVRHLAERVVNVVRTPGPDQARERRTWENIKDHFQIGSDPAWLPDNPSARRAVQSDLYELRAQLGREALGRIYPSDSESPK